MKPAATDWHCVTMSETPEAITLTSRCVGARLLTPPQPTAMRQAQPLMVTAVVFVVNILLHAPRSSVIVPTPELPAPGAGAIPVTVHSESRTGSGCVECSPPET